MSTYSKIILLKQANNQMKNNSKQATLNYLQDTYKQFQVGLQRNNPANLIFETTSNIQVSPFGVNENDFDFAEVKLCTLKDRLKDVIDKVHISTLKTDDGFRFTISPSGYLDVYNIEKQGQIAKLLNEAIEIVAEELFKATNCEVLITASDHSSAPDNVNDAVDNWIESSPFSMLRAGIIPELENHLDEIPANRLENKEGNITINVTGHPFSLSRFNPDGKEVFRTYQRIIHDLLQQLKSFK